ncbi:MAG TPA: YXWGXW repeat-containing protein [Ramlibacter sp.]|uniref:YXWGXW repeat-containing protein n=1 Tax=Ramlibacter sp. TaxID=1917967 RepID=UPI002BCFE82B|nr:YXWGXW repeat-containing protein [Ramlibacter sp.]HVZ46226.1 YXWGXW repeat-containing protein [Ramlibacter sp.]
MKRKSLVAFAAALSLAGVAAIAQAEVIVQYGPPAPIHEVIPAPRSGYVWSPGYYAWRDRRYVWVGGRWMNERPGYVWREARWVQRPDGSWFMTGGAWVQERYGYGYGRRDREDRWRDRDERRYDRYGANGDRDHDGVANWRDDHPRDPTRD